MLDWIVQITREQEVDVLLIAGDVFDVANHQQRSYNVL